MNLFQQREFVMGILKEMAARGAYFIKNGTIDFNSWSRLMIDDLGPNVKPFLKEIRQWSLIIAQRQAGAQSMKINCWDFHQCGRHISGEQKNKIPVCPAFLETRLAGINGGKNGGRACWVVPGTLCGGWVRRTLVPKYVACKLCGFKRTLLEEERLDRIISDRFLDMLIHERIR